MHHSLWRPCLEIAACHCSYRPDWRSPHIEGLVLGPGKRETDTIHLPSVVASLQCGIFLAFPFLTSISTLERALKATTKALSFQQEDGSFVSKTKRWSLNCEISVRVSQRETGRMRTVGKKSLQGTVKPFWSICVPRGLLSGRCLLALWWSIPLS